MSRVHSFQSTRPHGARLIVVQQLTAGTVSIHAPARGATLLRLIHLMLLCFNPRARAGRDGTAKRVHETHSSFNPRARTGRDQADDRLAHHY